MKSFLTINHLAIFATIAAALTLTACGGSSTANPNSVTGNWTVTLYNSNNVAAYVFTTTLNQQIASPSISSPVTGTNFNLKTSESNCFQAGSSVQQTGTFTLNDDFNGLVVNTLQLSVAGTNGGGSAATISMRGTFTTEGISGPWTITPSTGCTAGGTFMMTRS